MRAHIVVSDEVVTAIDALVGQRGRSRFLEQAAREKLARLELEKAIRVLAATMFEDLRAGILAAPAA